MEEVKASTNGYPSDFLSPEIKQTPEYSLKWAEYMEGIGVTGSANGMFPGFLPNTDISRFYVRRAYARGYQSIEKYKPQLGIDPKKAPASKKNSYRVLNFEILDVASKFFNILVGQLMQQDNSIGVMAVDKRAQDERRKKRIEFQEHVINRAFYDQVTQATGIAFESPVSEDVVPMPETLGQVDLHMKMFYKEKYCMAVQDMLKLIDEGDNYSETLADIARDLAEQGIAATKTYRVRNKVLRRKCHVERMGASATLKSNFEDIKWVFEDWDLTIGQLKEIGGDQLKEEDYRKIAETAGKQSYTNINVEDYYKANLCYPWDNTKVTVKDCVWFSPDWKTEQIAKNSFGNPEIQQKSYDWWKKLEDKGVTEKSFNQANESKVVRYPIDNQYQCLWIKGTKHVLNFGLSRDMLKNSSSLGRTIGPFTIYEMKKCITDSLMPILDNIQLQWLQFQHHAAKSVPAGQSIEFTALQDIAIEGASGDKLTPKEALQIYFETGILLWRRKDASGSNTNFQPIQELAGGIANAMEKHFNQIILNLNLLRDQLGLNEVTDASTPDGELGKAVAEMASGATKTALKPLHHAFDQINLGTKLRTVMHISGMAASGLAPEYTEALGMDTMSAIGLLSDLTVHELGVYLMKQPTEEINLWFKEFCQKGIVAGTLYEEEAMEILMESNVYTRIQLLKVYRQRKIDLERSKMQQQYDAEEKKNINSANATAEAQKGTLDYELEKKKELAWETEKARAWADKQKASNDAFLMQVQSRLNRGENLEEAEQKRMTELLKEETKGRYQLQVASMKPAPQPAKK